MAMCALNERCRVYGEGNVEWPGRSPPHTKGSSRRIDQCEVNDDADGDVDHFDASAVDVDDVGDAGVGDAVDDAVGDIQTSSNNISDIHSTNIISVNTTMRMIVNRWHTASQHIDFNVDFQHTHVIQGSHSSEARLRITSCGHCFAMSARAHHRARAHGLRAENVPDA